MTARDQTLLWLTDAGTLSDAELDCYAGWLGEGERQRCATFVRVQRRRQFIAGRALLRLMLARLLGMASGDVSVIERPGAAPQLELEGHRQAWFSISHSGRWVACAVSATCRVGVDVELIDSSRDISALATQAFDEAQCAWLASRSQQSRVRDFYNLWSTAEARFKLGVAHASSFEFSHPELSVALCCEHKLPCPPSLKVVMLAP